MASATTSLRARVGGFLTLDRALFVVGLGWALCSLLDPRLVSGRVGGPALAGLGWWLERRRARGWAVGPVSFVLAAALGFTAFSEPTFGADSPNYYVYLRSLVFDGDLDFSNEWETWGFPEQPRTATGLRKSVYAVGPAVLWSPFLPIAHVYVKLGSWLGFAEYAADGYSLPYLRACAAGTVTVCVLGVWLLFRVLVRRVDRSCALLSAAAAVGASPIFFYVFVNPTMAHGLTFGVSCMALWAADRVEREPSFSRWIALGALVGVVLTLRWQAFVVAILPVVFALRGLMRRSDRPQWLAAGALAGLLAFSPQMLAWRLIHGQWIWLPENEHTRGMFYRFDWSSPYLLNVLLHADRGFFIWTPVMALGVLGLAFAVRRFGVLAVVGLLLFAATAYVNGSIGDWAGSDSFGSRRFDLIVPFLALGLTAPAGALLRRPALAVGLLVAATVAWNAGLTQLYRTQAITEAAPLVRVAELQAMQVHNWIGDSAGELFGDRGRALAYKMLVGEYFYWNLNLSGTVDLGQCDRRYLAGGWSSPENRTGPPSFRWALHPRSCIRFPLESAFDLRTVITARAPSRLSNQVMTVGVNGLPVHQAALTEEWADVRFTIGQAALKGGENVLCLQFSQGLEQPEGQRHAAAVSRIQFP